MLIRYLSLTLLLAMAGLAAAVNSAAPTPSLPRPPFDAERSKTLQQEWARAFGVDAQLTNSLGMKLVLIPAGRFTMGPNGSTYRVTLARPFYLGVTEVTLGQYRHFKKGHKVEGADNEFNAEETPHVIEDSKLAAALPDAWASQPVAGGSRVYWVLRTNQVLSLSSV